jgi:hypothetical protein
MPQVGFEPMIPVFDRAKTFHTLDRVATVVVQLHNCIWKDLDRVSDKWLIIPTEDFRDLSILLEASSVIIPCNTTWPPF